MNRKAAVIYCVAVTLLAVLFFGKGAYADSNHFVDIAMYESGIILDIRYATPNNFTGQTIYPNARCLLRNDVAMRLLRVQKALQKQGYGLIVFDCYRPFSVQKKFWEILPDERYVANPAKGGSTHNRGAAVDVALADSTGKPLSMPTKYDDFSEKADRSYKRTSREALHNSALLESVMKAEGFLPFQSEWWHYDVVDWARYPISDFPVQKQGCED
ncbi:MAG: M15 family metallopeptidase [Chlorobiaceae bacterium]|nr:M15 family metallopeptidase [Chlorobiaceae bacterium]NTW63986.1 M15 family metallopeptidase [Chlorobiaceae bacterium]